MPMGSQELEGLTLGQGRYWIIRKLAEGGMGTVYRAQDRNIESEVVIKIPRAAMMDDPEFAARFTREIRSLVKLSHPHIVKVSDVGTWEGTPFAVMQFLPGGSLEDRRPIGPDGQPYPCDRESVSSWLDPVAQALDYIHTQGYVHRDVKPGNILFDSEGHAFLGDFGVAKVLASANDKPSGHTAAMTGTGMVLGTPEYMAPELIMGEPFDGRADQYALAITVYELLCGRRPFENETKTKVLVLHTSKAPPRLTEWCPELPESLSQAVLKGLSKEASERYPSCAALAAAVAATINGGLARDARVRLKCPKCGKAGSMAAADYGKLRKSGGRPSCSLCKISLDVVGGSADNERSGGNKRTPTPGGTGTYELSNTPQPTLIEKSGSLAASRNGASDSPSPKGRTPQPTLIEQSPPNTRVAPKTMIESPSARPNELDGPAPRTRGPQPTLIEQVPPNTRVAPKTMIENLSAMPKERDGSAPRTRGPQQTLIEQSPLVPRGGAKTMIEASPFMSDRQGAMAPGAGEPSLSRDPKAPSRKGKNFGVSGPPHSNPVQPWMVIAAGTGTALLVMVAAAVLLIPRNNAAPAPAGPTAPAPVGTTTREPTDPKVALVPAKTKRPSSTEAFKKAPIDEASPGSAPGPDERSPEPAPAVAEETAPAPAPAPAAKPKMARRGGRPKTETAALPAPESKRAPKSAPTPLITFNPEKLKLRPKKTYSLTKVLAAPKELAEQLVVPTGMFHLTASPSDHVDGRRKYIAIERSMQRGNAQNPLGMTSSPYVELEVEPGLAQRFDLLGSKLLENNMSILTLWISAGGQVMIVKVDILQDYKLGFKKATHYPEGDIDYYTLRVTAQGQVLVKSDDEEWETPERMLHFARVYHAKVSVYKMRLQAGEQSQLNSMMGGLYKGMLAGAAAKELEAQQQRNRVMGR